MICSPDLTAVKICGLTNPEDAQMALDLGADMLGFVNAPDSPRYLTPDEIAQIINEVQPTVPTVLVTHSQDTDYILNSYEAAATDILQLHAPLSMPQYEEIRQMAAKITINISIDTNLQKLGDSLITRICECSQMADYLLFDARVGKEIGGTGKSYEWSLAADAKEYAEKPVIMAGGLNPMNVADAVKQVKPYGVDVSSGIEKVPGKKDPTLLEAFIKNAKSVTN